jgi:hypothetical protein
MHKAIVKRYNLLRSIQRMYEGLLVIYKNPKLFSKALHMKILLVHWELDNLRSSIGKRQKDA